MKLHQKAIFAVAFASLGTIAAPAFAQETAPIEEGAETISPERLALAQQIVDRGFPEETRETAFFGTMDQMVGQMREASLAAGGLDDEGAVAILDEWITDYVANSKTVLRGHIPRLMDGLARAYANTFTQDELNDILAFVSTSSGQRFFELSPALIAEPNFAAANQAYMDEVMGQLPKAQGELRDRLMEYFQNKAASEPTTSES